MDSDRCGQGPGEGGALPRVVKREQDQGETGEGNYEESHA